MADARGLAVGTVLGGEYEIERPLAKGGMGAVYVARQRSTRKQRAGVVHRDLKPDNIFLGTPRREGVPFMVKVLDFGIAKLMHESSNRLTTSAIGAPIWMAPEQTDIALGVSPATDVWAVGLIVFQLLTGRSYWFTANGPDGVIASLLRELLHDPLPSASDRAAALGVTRPLPSGFDA